MLCATFKALIHKSLGCWEIAISSATDASYSAVNAGGFGLASGTGCAGSYTGFGLATGTGYAGCYTGSSFFTSSSFFVSSTTGAGSGFGFAGAFFAF